jgi:HPt (histidine-containing phosphotransfer) domain-containing protein
MAQLGKVLGRWIDMTPPKDLPRLASYDRAALRGWLGDDESTIRSVLAEFVANARADARDLAAALNTGDMRAAGAAVHKLKGGALSIGARRLQRLTVALEVATRRGDDSACRSMLGSLASELEQTAKDIGD